MEKSAVSYVWYKWSLYSTKQGRADKAGHNVCLGATRIESIEETEYIKCFFVFFLEKKPWMFCTCQEEEEWISM